MWKSLIVALSIALAAAVWLFLHGWASMHGGETPDKSKDAVPVQSAIVERRDVPVSTNAIGTVQAYNSVLVRTRVDGQLDQVAFVEGQDVHAGDVLARIDARPFQAQLEGAQAQKEKDAAQLANAERDFKRYSEIAPRGAVPVQTLDAARMQVDELKAAMRVDEAAIDSAQIQLGYTTIRAPLDGRTGARLIDAGNMVHASDTNGLVLITQVHPIAVSFTLPQDLLPELVAAQRLAPVHVDALRRDSSERLEDGSISLIDNQIDSATGTIHCKATFDNASDKLWPGQFVALRVVLGTRHDALTLPATAVQSGADGPYVFVIKDSGIADLRHVKFVRGEQDLDVVTDGLSAGERVVTEGQYKLESGTRVRVVAPPAPHG